MAATGDRLFYDQADHCGVSRDISFLASFIRNYDSTRFPSVEISTQHVLRQGRPSPGAIVRCLAPSVQRQAGEGEVLVRDMDDPVVVHLSFIFK